MIFYAIIYSTKGKVIDTLQHKHLSFLFAHILSIALFVKARIQAFLQLLYKYKVRFSIVHERIDKMAKERILAVDDEEYMRSFIKKALEKENMIVSLAGSGSEAINIMKSSSFDLVLLDVMMDDLDGFEVVKQLRNLGIDIPILLLSGKDEDYNKILGMGLGADDYITKPFSPAVLCAKIKAYIRRTKTSSEGKSSTIVRPPFKFNCSNYKLYKNDMEIPLSSKETMLIKFFLEKPDQVFTKEQLYQNVWENDVVDDKTIMVYICHLRNKIEENPQNPKYLKTVWGIGYKFSTNE